MPSNGADLQDPQFGVFGETGGGGLAETVAGHKEQGEVSPSALWSLYSDLCAPDPSSDQDCI